MRRKNIKSMNIRNGLEKRDPIMNSIKILQSIKTLYERNPVKGKS